jgi:phosphoglucosamine mutase
MEKKLRRLFGTDGVRGVANIEPMTTETAMRLGRAVAYIFHRPGHRGKIVIGKDTRLSGYMFEQAMAAGICSMGADVQLCGPLPTPGIAFITSSMRADAGVVISASHNPYQDNGIKIFASDGFKLPDSVEARIEELMEGGELDSRRPPASDVGKAVRIDDARGRYIVFLKNSFPRQRVLDGFKIVVDCAHGAAYKVAPAVLQELGATVYAIGDEPDGKNINDHVGALHPQAMCQAVVDLSAHVGIALDGDADRVIFADEKGQIVDGDSIMGLCAQRMIQRGELRNNTLVATVMSNLGLEQAMHHMGGKLLRTQVGDRYVVEAMRQHGCNLGGEQSGHLIFLDHMTTGDGMIAALQVLSVMAEQGRPLSELCAFMRPYPQVLVNVKVRHKHPITELPEVQRLITQIEAHLGNDGRVLVRYSGTEPKARVMLEGPDEAMIAMYAGEIAQALVRACGAG